VVGGAAAAVDSVAEVGGDPNDDVARDDEGKGRVVGTRLLSRARTWLSASLELIPLTFWVHTELVFEALCCLLAPCHSSTSFALPSASVSNGTPIGNTPPPLPGNMLDPTDPTSSCAWLAPSTR
jgi:hypothetical protein